MINLIAFPRAAGMKTRVTIQSNLDSPFNMRITIVGVLRWRVLRWRMLRSGSFLVTRSQSKVSTLLCNCLSSC